MELPGYDNWLTHNPAEDFDEEEITLNCFCENCEWRGELEVVVILDRADSHYDWVCPDCNSDNSDLYVIETNEEED